MKRRNKNTEHMMYRESINELALGRLSMKISVLLKLILTHKI